MDSLSWFVLCFFDLLLFLCLIFCNVFRLLFYGQFILVCTLCLCLVVLVFKRLREAAKKQNFFSGPAPKRGGGG